MYLYLFDPWKCRSKLQHYHIFWIFGFQKSHWIFERGDYGVSFVLKLNLPHSIGSLLALVWLLFGSLSAPYDVVGARDGGCALLGSLVLRRPALPPADRPGRPMLVRLLTLRVNPSASFRTNLNPEPGPVGPTQRYSSSELPNMNINM